MDSTLHSPRNVHSTQEESASVGKVSTDHIRKNARVLEGVTL